MKNSHFFFIISFSLAILVSEKAMCETLTVSASSQATIAPVLELVVSQEGRSEITFGNVTPSATQIIQTEPVVLFIAVKSNTGDQYQVTQLVGGPLRNENGDEISQEKMDFISSSQNGTGASVPERSPSSSTAQTIFTSDVHGTSENIRVEYHLSVPPSQAPGSYSSQITYTVFAL